MTQGTEQRDRQQWSLQGVLAPWCFPDGQESLGQPFHQCQNWKQVHHGWMVLHLRVEGSARGRPARQAGAPRRMTAQSTWRALPTLQNQHLEMDEKLPCVSEGLGDTEKFPWTHQGTCLGCLKHCSTAQDSSWPQALRPAGLQPKGCSHGPPPPLPLSGSPRAQGGLVPPALLLTAVAGGRGDPVSTVHSPLPWQGLGGTAKEAGMQGVHGAWDGSPSEQALQGMSRAGVRHPEGSTTLQQSLGVHFTPRQTGATSATPGQGVG